MLRSLSPSTAQHAQMTRFCTIVPAASGIALWQRPFGRSAGSVLPRPAWVVGSLTVCDSEQIIRVACSQNKIDEREAAAGGGVPVLSARSRRYWGSARGSPKWGKTLLSANQVMALIWL
jgi:hypothetical protein